MDKNAIIEKFTKQVASLLERIRQLEQENVMLKEKIARLEKNLSNSSKPPSSDIVKPKKIVRKVSRKKRKRGGQYGHKKFSPQPFEPEQVLEETLGEDFGGIVGADYWGAYRKYARLFDVRVQYCMAHLIREIRFLAEHKVKNLSRWANELLEWLKKLFDTLHRREKLTARGFIRSMEKIKAGFLKRMRHPPNHKLAKKLARRFKGKAAEDYFRFLGEPEVEPTNNGTERQIRPVVIDRRITQGTRGDAGMRWCERIWTTIASCKKHDFRPKSQFYSLYLSTNILEAA